MPCCFSRSDRNSEVSTEVVPTSAGCCRFAGGPYLAPEYLGTGLAIATAKDDPLLARAFDYALHEISAKGTFAELYLRYFPVSFF